MGRILKFVEQGTGRKPLQAENGAGKGLSAWHVLSDDLLSTCEVQALTGPSLSCEGVSTYPAASREPRTGWRFVFKLPVLFSFSCYKSNTISLQTIQEHIKIQRIDIS